MKSNYQQNGFYNDLFKWRDKQMKSQNRAQSHILMCAFAISLVGSAIADSPQTIAAKPNKTQTALTHNKAQTATTKGASIQSRGASPLIASPETPEQIENDHIVQLQQDDSVNFTKFGDAAAKLGNWLQAHAKYQQALTAWPDNSEALYGMGKCAVQAGDLPGAIGYYRSVIYTTEPGRYGTVPGDGFQENNVTRLMEFAVLLGVVA